MSSVVNNAELKEFRFRKIPLEYFLGALGCGILPKHQEVTGFSVLGLMGAGCSSSCDGLPRFYRIVPNQCLEKPQNPHEEHIPHDSKVF